MGASTARVALLLVVTSGLTVGSAATRATEPTGAEYSIRARVGWGGARSRAADGSFELRAEVAGNAALFSYGGDYALGARAGVDHTVAQGCDCLCAAGTNFSDGFESGSTAAWSGTFP